MAYIVKADYKTRINTDLLNKVISDNGDNGDDLLASVSKIAEDTVNTMAGVLYDLTAEFLKVGNARNGLVLAMTLNIATYNIYQRIDDEGVPQKVIKNYDDTIDDLVKMSLGKMQLDLPPKTDPDASNPGGGDGEGSTIDGNGLRRLGSQPKRTHNV